MKFLPVALVLLLLASCTGWVEEDTQTETTDTTEVTIPAEDEFMEDMEDEINDMDDMGDTSMNFENEVVEVDAGYNHPGGRTNMTVTMEINDWIIQSIEASAPENLRRSFNDALQELVGSPVSDAENFYAAWSSIASEAFNEAVKSI